MTSNGLPTGLVLVVHSTKEAQVSRHILQSPGREGFTYSFLWSQTPEHLSIFLWPLLHCFWSRHGGKTFCTMGRTRACVMCTTKNLSQFLVPPIPSCVILARLPCLWICFLACKLELKTLPLQRVYKDWRLQTQNSWHIVHAVELQ